MVLHSIVFPTIPIGYDLNSPNISNDVKLIKCCFKCLIYRYLSAISTMDLQCLNFYFLIVFLISNLILNNSSSHNFFILIIHILFV